MLPVSISSLSAYTSLAAAPSVDVQQAATHLAEMLRFKTVWPGVEGPAPTAELKAMREYLAKTYPLVHQKFAVEQIGESLLFKWEPKTPSRQKPMMFMSHMDVVPIEPGTEGKWEHPPFAGVIADGKVYGRGAIDTKGTLCAQLEAIESLLAAGAEPTRPIYLAYGADEEVLGQTGAARIAKTLEDRGVQVDFIIDEGTPVIDGKGVGIAKDAAIVGLSEKGFISVELTATGPAGHSSIPLPDTAIEVLTRVIGNIQDNKPSPRMTEPVREMLKALAREMPLAKRLALQAGVVGEWLFMRDLDKRPTTAAMIRSISTPTIINGGIKDNVVPGTATAVVNFRTLPGESVDDTLERVKEAIGDAKVTIKVIENAHPASAVSSATSAGFMAMSAGVRAAFGDDVTMVPTIAIGATDARYYEKVAKDAYRFSPFKLTNEDIGSIHASNEKLSIENLGGAIRFYQTVLQQAAF